MRSTDLTPTSYKLARSIQHSPFAFPLPVFAPKRPQTTREWTKGKAVSSVETLGQCQRLSTDDPPRVVGQRCSSADLPLSAVH